MLSLPTCGLNFSLNPLTLSMVLCSISSNMWAGSLISKKPANSKTVIYHISYDVRTVYIVISENCEIVVIMII